MPNLTGTKGQVISGRYDCDWRSGVFWFHEIQGADAGQKFAGSAGMRVDWNGLYFCPDAPGAEALFPGEHFAFAGEGVKAAATDT